MRVWLRSTILIAALVLVVGPPAAQADFDGPAYAFPVPDYGSVALQYGILDSYKRQDTKGGGTRTPPRPSPALTDAQLAKVLRFVPMSATRRGNVERLADALVAEHPALDRAKVIGNLRSGRVYRQLGRLLRRDGWSGNDLGDAMALNLVYSWLAYRTDVQRTSTAQDNAVRKDFRAALARAGAASKLRVLSNAAKQTAAETLGVTALFRVAMNGYYREQGSAEDYAEFRSRLRQRFRDAYGIDLAKVRITTRGLER